ncbi:MAG: RNase adapter RapZ [Deltaproteobacteria bacterium]|nr:RNase adapter RapZ [Deltaproteobacteria bacterium]
MSGSGKTTAIRALEDAGFYAIDNLPIVLLDKVVNLSSGGPGEIHKLAVVVDARGGASLAKLPAAIDSARSQGHDVLVLFLDAEDAVLERRYSETRRRHPLSEDESVKAGIAKERAILEPLRDSASAVVNSTGLSVHDLKREILRRVAAVDSIPSMTVNVKSFGFRNGLPSDSDLVFDVRFLPNPYFIDALRPLSGKDSPCADYVLARTETKTFLEHLTQLLDFLLPQFENEGKAYLTISIGCTGGRHRSVAIAERLAEWLRTRGKEPNLEHRDLDKNRSGP